MELASEKQLSFIKKLGGTPNNKMSGFEASKMIRELIKNGATIEDKPKETKKTKETKNEEIVKETHKSLTTYSPKNEENNANNIDVSKYKDNSIKSLQEYIDNNKAKLGKSLDNKDKTVEKCYKYIENEVRNGIKTGFVMCTDEDVFNLVDKYYLEYEEAEDIKTEIKNDTKIEKTKNVSKKTENKTIKKDKTIKQQTLDLFGEFGDILG